MAEKPGVLRNLRIKRVALVDKGANFDTATGDGAHIMLYKRDLSKDAGLGSVHVDSPEWDADDADEYEKATLDAAGRRKLSDSDFLAVWTDAEGKKHRKLPVHDAGHIAAARGRIDGAQIPEDVKAAARRKLEHLNSPKEKTVAKTMKDLFAKMAAALAETDVTKRTLLLKEAEEDAEKMGPPAPGTPEHEGAEKEHIGALQNLHKTIGGQLTKMGEGPHPGDHPYHKMKAMHEHLSKMLKAMGCDTGEQMVPTEAPAHVTKALTDLEKANVSLQKRLDQEIEKREEGEMLTILKSFKATPFKLEGDDSDVKKFRKMQREDPAGYSRMMELFKAADAQIATSNLFKNIGAGGGGNSGSAYAEAEALAETMVTKMAGSLTKEQAIDKVFSDNPKLYSRYVEEQQ